MWVRTFHDSATARPRLRINAHGPVTLEGGVAKGFEYTVKVSVRARTRDQARAILERVELRTESQNEWFVLTTPGRETTASVTMRAPHLRDAVVSSSDGAVEAYGIDGTLTVDTGADQVKVDRIHGNCTLATGGGDIHAGTVDGYLHCLTGAGAIVAKAVRGEALVRTNGGDITLLDVGGLARAETGGGTVHLGRMGSTVTVTNGGGPITIDQAAGTVTTRDMAGPVTVRGAAGIRCESANGGITLGQISGPMSVYTAMGSIVANLQGSRLGESTLKTGNGDITVLIPSNVGVRINAENRLADSLQRIQSAFREIQPQLIGMRVLAEGRVNGGGPLLQLFASSGTIFLKRQ
ncbi:MAG TPA: hypothetical protein VMB03_25595 [Bryobacteraceae bacterium]|nr:hypothetical protein [Bryobacteraceae bacterium]